MNITQEEAIAELLQLEEKHKVYDYKFLGLPLYSLIRYRVRGDYVHERSGIRLAKIPSKDFQASLAIKGFFVSLISIWRAFIKPKKVLFFGFSRLDKIDNYFVDRFVDPVIKLTEHDDFWYVTYGKSGTSPKPQYNSTSKLNFDILYAVSYIFGVILSPVVFLVYPFAFCKVKRIIKYIFKSEVKPAQMTAQYFFEYLFFRLLFSVTRIETIFGVSRVIFNTASYAAKKQKITVFELQHGITHGPTRLYSGYYNPEIDPDFFLTFGNYCDKDVFGVPADRIIHIGWAFKDFVNMLPMPEHFGSNTILMVSEPHISVQMTSCLCLLAQNFPELTFHIRRHPLEEFTIEQSTNLKKFINVIDVSSAESSFYAILRYRLIIGNNSSVLFEALSLGKEVGRLDFYGLQAKNKRPIDGFTYLTSLEDVRRFVYDRNVSNAKKIEIYSDFDKIKFLSLLPNSSRTNS